MKLRTPGRGPNQSRRGSRRGVAIITVLVLTALMTTLAISLMQGGASATRFSASVHDSMSVRASADTAVNMALAQLRRATGGSLQDGTPKPWVSQPGLVTTFREDGRPDAAHRLYSAEGGVATDASRLSADVPSDWAEHPDTYADLNDPVADASGQLRFPICDPTLIQGAEPVEGFSVSPAGAPAGTVAGQRLPMPVRWIYMLADGTMGVADTDGKFVSKSGAGASAENPIVSRFAWWTDDESCKVNINTASEGVAWDMPRADTAQERSLAENQPLSREYHRQPGHPRGVSLSSVLLPGRRFHAAGFGSSTGPLQAMNPLDAQLLWRLGRLDVSVDTRGTSFGGRQRSSAAEGSMNDLPLLWSRYSSVSELLFDHAPGASAGLSRPVHAFFQRHPEAAHRLRGGEFFLTAESAAPEITLFGTPRIALWPVHGSAFSGGGTPVVERTTDYDMRVAAVSTLNGRSYSVQRLRPSDGSWDLEKANLGQNRALYEYLRTLTNRPFPGWNRPDEGMTTFAAKYGEGESGDRDTILLSMLDYVRAANFADGQLHRENQFSTVCPGNAAQGFGQVSPLAFAAPVGAGGATKAPRGLGRVPTVSEIALVFVCRAEMNSDGKIIGEPSSRNRSQMTPGSREIEGGLLIEAFVPSHGWVDYRPYVSFSLTGGAPGAPPDPSAPWPQLYACGNLLEPSVAKPWGQSTEEPPREWIGWGGTAGVRGLTERLLRFKPFLLSGLANRGASFTFSTASGGDVPPQLKLAIYDDPGSASTGRAGAADLIQVIPLEFPDIGNGLSRNTMQIPRLPGEGYSFTLEKRIAAAREGKPLFSPQDVVQSLVPCHGDYRLLAGQRRAEIPRDSASPNVAHAVFVAHPLWGKRQHAHSIREPSAGARRAVLGRADDQADPDNPDSLGYFPGLEHCPAFTPDYPLRQYEEFSVISAVAGAHRQTLVSEVSDWTRLDSGRRGPANPAATGDFDNGAGNAPDGPYSNRPDDGDVRAVLKRTTPYFDDGGRTETDVPPVSGDLFSPQRMLPSAAMFGSLPTGVVSHVPWQTLLFRPHAAHYGAQSPPDHLLLDLFWQPVLEPEPHSRAFETEGKVNLNHQIYPFTYIRRATALHALLKAETLMAIPDEDSRTYKSGEKQDARYRHFIDAAGTIRLWDAAASEMGRPFLVPSEICAHYLVPEGRNASRQAMEDFWKTHRLTGDNTKERPYANLYPRLTTRSNVFRVHFIAQSLRKSASAPSDRFVSATDIIAGTVRGSALLRRSLDESSRDIPDYAAPAPASGKLPALRMESFMRWSIENFTTFP